MKNRCFIRVSILTLFTFMNTCFYGQLNSKLWKEVSISNSNRHEKSSVIPKDANYYQLNLTSLNKKLSKIQDKKNSESVIVKFPNSKGEILSYTVKEASVFQPELQQQHPNIRSYIGTGNNSTIRFSVSPQKGLSLTYISGKDVGFIEKKSNATYAVFKRSSGNKLLGTFECSTIERNLKSNLNLNKNITNKEANDLKLRTYLLALSVTAEYTEYHFGGPVGIGQESAAKSAALAAMNATITRVSGIFERDFGVKLTLINNINNIIYTDPSSDPYSDVSNIDNWGFELQTNLTNTINESNYDIGHLFGHSGGGGNAGCIGCVCVDNLKGSGYTSPANSIPEGDFFDIDFVAHEIGHQFGANHTWTTDDGPSNEGFGANLEPGSGSTIMGYAGITTSNVQSQGDDYFHFKSIEQVTDFIKTTTCQTESTLTQKAPTSNAGFDYTIPASTAFILNGDGSSDGSSTFCWEQNDIGGNGGIETSNPSPTNTTGPMFRSYKPTSSSIRYMPNLTSVLLGNLSTAWESVSAVSRDLNFKLTVRDNMINGGQNAIDEMTVTVDANSGPFTITSQNSQGITWNGGNTETITWDVANTRTAPVNTSNVNILISIDGGNNFSTLLANTPNDGNQEITVPFTPAPFCRIMIQAVDNIYFAVNSHEFSIDYLVEETCNTYSDTPNMPITDNSVGFDETTIEVPGDFILSEANISMDITHSWLSDLLITIVSPSGKEIKLIERACTSNEGLIATFNDTGSILNCQTPTQGTFVPSESLANFNGETGNGTWTIRINDNGAEDVGVLNSWAIEACETELTPLEVDYGPLNSLSIYPNPSSSFLNISLISNSTSDITAQLFDLAGRLIKSQDYEKATNNFNGLLDYGSISQGIYILKVVQNNIIMSQKVIIE